MGATKRAFQDHQEQIERAIALAEERPRLTVEAANMLLLLKAASNLICDLRPSCDGPYGIEKSIDALVARVEARS
jgi:hypothetical protein